MDTLLQDLRYACRTLLNSPGFAAVTILCLALGIGVNSTIFSVVDAIAIRPLPFRDPDRLVAVGSTKVANATDLGGVSYLDLRDWRERTRSFETIAAVQGRNFSLSDGGEAERFLGAFVSWDLFPMLGIQPVLGRQFRPVEWITAIGVVNDFRLFTVRDGKPSPYAFVSYPYDPFRNTGITIRVAGMAPASITSAVREQIRASDPTLPIFQVQTGDEARANTYWEYRLYGWMFSVFGVVALVLAAIGVYGVLSYSVTQRLQEIGVRMALGATRPNVFRLIVGDGTRLAALGIVAGFAGAFGVTRIIASLLYNVSATDPLSFLGTAAFLVIVAVAASYVPARRATAVDPMIALRAE